MGHWSVYTAMINSYLYFVIGIVGQHIHGKINEKHFKNLNVCFD